MGHLKRPKSKGNTIHKHVAVKQAIKKKYRAASKSKNDELRAMLDNQSSLLYSINRPVELDLKTSKSLKNDLASMQDLTASLGKL